MSQSSVDSALAFMLSAAATPTVETSRTIVQVMVKAGKVQRVKGTALPNESAAVKAAPSKTEKEVVRSSHPAPEPLCFFPKGTLDPRGFLRAMNVAPSMDLKIQAIAAYCGYDKSRGFGVQEFNARSMALRALRKVDPAVASLPLRGEQRSIVRSVQGFVAGLPNTVARQVRDLEAREALAAETMAEQSKIASDPNVSEDDRRLAAGLAEAERERISHIRADLAHLGVMDQAAE